MAQHKDTESSQPQPGQPPQPQPQPGQPDDPNQPNQPNRPRGEDMNEAARAELQRQKGRSD